MSNEVHYGMVIDTEHCVGCHLCLNVCPVADCILPRHTEFKPGRHPHPVTCKLHYR